MIRLSKLVGPFLFLGITILLGCEGGQSEALLDDLLEAEVARDEFKNEATKLSTDLENTKGELNRAKTEFATLGQVRENLEKEKKNLEQEVDKLEKEGKELNTKFEDANKSLGKLETEKARLEKDVEKLTADIDKANQAIQDIEKDKSDLEQKIANQETLIKDTSANLESLELERDGLKDQVKKLEVDLQAIDTVEDVGQARLQKQIDAYKQDLEKTEADLDTAIEEKNNLEDEKDDLDKSIKKLTEELEDASETLSGLEKKNAKITKDRDDIQVELDSAIAELEKAGEGAGVVKKLEAEKDQLKADLDIALGDLERAGKDQGEAIKELQAKRDELKKSLDDANKSLLLIQLDKEGLEKDLATITKEIDTANNSLTELQEANKKLASNVDTLKEKLATAEATLESLLNQKPTIKKLISRNFAVTNFFHLKNVADAIRAIKFQIPATAKDIRIAGSFTSTYDGVEALIRDGKGLDNYIKWRNGDLEKDPSITNWASGFVKEGKLIDAKGLREWAGPAIDADKLKKPLLPGTTYYLIFYFYNDECQGFLCLGDKVASTTITGGFSLSYIE